MSTGSTHNRPAQVTCVPEVVIDISSESDSSPQVSDLIEEWQEKTKPFNLALKATDNFTNEDLSAIGNALTSLHQLAGLNISEDLLRTISSEAAESLGNGLAQSSSLLTLDMTLDSISPDTARALAAHIRGNDSIETLRLRGTKPQDVFPFLHFLTIPIEIFPRSREDRLGKLQTLKVFIKDCKIPPDSIHALLDAFFAGHDSLKSTVVFTKKCETSVRYATNGFIANPYDNVKFAKKTRASDRELMASRKVLAVVTRSLFSDPDHTHPLPQEISAMVGNFITHRNSYGRQKFSGLLRTTKAGYEAAMKHLSADPKWAHLRMLRVVAAELSQDEVKEMGSIINPHLLEIIKEITGDTKTLEFSTADVRSVAALLRYLMRVEKALAPKREEAMRQRQKSASSAGAGRVDRGLRFCPDERPRNRTECIAAAKHCITSTFIAAFLFIGSTALAAGAMALVWYLIESGYTPPGARTPTPSPIM